MLLADGFRASTKLSASFFAVHRSNLLELFLHILFETYTSLSPIRRGFEPDFVNYKKGVLDSQPQVIKFTSCLPMVGGSLRVLRFLPPLKLVAII
jgi:hypothetical protein